MSSVSGASLNLSKMLLAVSSTPLTTPMSPDERSLVTSSGRREGHRSGKSLLEMKDRPSDS